MPMETTKFYDFAVPKRCRRKGAREASSCTLAINVTPSRWFCIRLSPSLIHTGHGVSLKKQLSHFLDGRQIKHTSSVYWQGQSMITACGSLLLPVDYYCQCKCCFSAEPHQFDVFCTGMYLGTSPI